MPLPKAEVDTLRWISDQVQRETCLDREDANHYAGGLLTGWRMGRDVPDLCLGEAEARALAQNAVAADRLRVEAA